MATYNSSSSYASSSIKFIGITLFGAWFMTTCCSSGTRKPSNTLDLATISETPCERALKEGSRWANGDDKSEHVWCKKNADKGLVPCSIAADDLSYYCTANGEDLIPPVEPTMTTIHLVRCSTIAPRCNAVPVKDVPKDSVTFY
jgi:hypothetical protein